ncbi:hypothetical protein [Marinicauda sp. Alg238-R41]|uniref:hypothetical protein n=1 Tax=Marinicauda sp. Alg238-R41 TaxID=2993447 RepID=UPI0022E340D0|nr:hypothetical protein [Marinicauda sp. Alg238-R41]
MTAFWSAPPEWPDERVFILGGGPSLTRFDAETIRGKGRVIACNNAGLDLAPWADVLFAADGRWFGWNTDRLHLNQSRYRVTRQDPREDWLPWPVQRVRHDKERALSEAPDTVCGACSGAMAVNLAYLFGAGEIILLGFDMRPGNYHANHKTPGLPQHYENQFIPALARMVAALDAKGVRVINATPGSAFTGAPMADLEALL